MFNCQDLPKDNEDLDSIRVDLPRLSDDSPESSPVGVIELLDYLGLEAPGGSALSAEDLIFRRTIDLGDAQFWIWSFDEPEGRQPAYATIREDIDGTITIGYDSDNYGLSPEQFVVGEYCRRW